MQQDPWAHRPKKVRGPQAKLAAEAPIRPARVTAERKRCCEVRRFMREPTLESIASSRWRTPAAPACLPRSTAILILAFDRLTETPFGNSASLSRRDNVRIAQRFNAGLRQEGKPVPEGRQKSGFRVRASAVPPGLWRAPTTRPSVETPGYCRMSLRDRIPPEFPKGIRARSGCEVILPASWFHRHPFGNSPLVSPGVVPMLPP